MFNGVRTVPYIPRWRNIAVSIRRRNIAISLQCMNIAISIRDDFKPERKGIKKHRHDNLNYSNYSMIDNN